MCEAEVTRTKGSPRTFSLIKSASSAVFLGCSSKIISLLGTPRRMAMSAIFCALLVFSFFGGAPERSNLLPGF